MKLSNTIEQPSPVIMELPYDKENSANAVTIIVTNPQRSCLALKKREGGKFGLPSGSGVLNDRRFNGDIRLAAIAEALHTLGRQDLEPFFGNADIKLLAVYKSNIDPGDAQVIPLYELILPDWLTTELSTYKSLEKAEWCQLDKLPQPNQFAFEHADFIREWLKKRQDLVQIVS